MARVCLVHGWDGDPNTGWFRWLRSEFEHAGHRVIAPRMPGNVPTMRTWVPALSRAVGAPDHDLVLLGHSAGCITILRYLEGIDQKIAGAVLVAGFVDDLGLQELSNYFQTPIDWNKIKANCPSFAVLQSDDDPWVPREHGTQLHEHLGGELLVEKNKGHFTGLDGIDSLPSARDAILNIIKNN